MKNVSNNVCFGNVTDSTVLIWIYTMFDTLLKYIHMQLHIHYTLCTVYGSVDHSFSQFDKQDEVT